MWIKTFLDKISIDVFTQEEYEILYASYTEILNLIKKENLLCKEDILAYKDYLIQLVKSNPRLSVERLAYAFCDHIHRCEYEDLRIQRQSEICQDIEAMRLGESLLEEELLMMSQDGEIINV